MNKTLIIIILLSINFAQFDWSQIMFLPNNLVRLDSFLNQSRVHTPNLTTWVPGTLGFGSPGVGNIGGGILVVVHFCG